MERLRRLDIQTKIILVLIAVIVPTFLLVTVLENKLARPLFEAEIRQIGVNTAESLATKIESHNWLRHPQGYAFVEAEIQELIYLQPSIMRMDVFVPDLASGLYKLVASSVEQDEPIVTVPPIEKVLTRQGEDDEGITTWEIQVPIRRPSVGKTTPKLHGIVRVVATTKTVHRLLEAFWRITGAAAIVSVIILVLVLSFFLRKTFLNERLLRRAEDQNIQLSEQLHDAQRQLMNVEKLAVMGQLTANFAHEIGTPLNAIGGHMQLLAGELRDSGQTGKWKERLEIVGGELKRIEEIVKGFLQTTAKPVSQKQLVDINGLVDKSLGIVKPRLDALGTELHCSLDRSMGPMRVVPLDIEQILLNLITNSLDSLQAKRGGSSRQSLRLNISTKNVRKSGEDWAEIAVYDTGLGISRSDLKNVIKPFFTTKSPGEGTGLGLTICQQLASKYGGVLDIDAREGAWAKVKVRIPYQTDRPA